LTDNQNVVGLISYDETIHAGGYPAGNHNHNYYLYNNTVFWTMSPAGTSSDPNAVIWRITDSVSLDYHSAYITRNLRPVINLKANTTVTGSGTSDSHWVVQ